MRDMRGSGRKRRRLGIGLRGRRRRRGSRKKRRKNGREQPRVRRGRREEERNEKIQKYVYLGSTVCNCFFIRVASLKNSL